MLFYIYYINKKNSFIIYIKEKTLNIIACNNVTEH